MIRFLFLHIIDSPKRQTDKLPFLIHTVLPHPPPMPFPYILSSMLIFNYFIFKCSFKYLLFSSCFLLQASVPFDNQSNSKNVIS